MTKSSKSGAHSVPKDILFTLNDPAVPHFTGLWLRDLAQLDARADQGFIAWPTAFLFLGNSFMLRFSLHPGETRGDKYVTSHMLWHYRVTPTTIVMTPYMGDDRRPFDTAWRVGPGGALETRFAGDDARAPQSSWFRYLPVSKWSDLVKIGFDGEYMLKHVGQVLDVGPVYDMKPDFPSFKDRT